MINHFAPSAIEGAKKHALKEHPKESCGLIIGSRYYRCKNIADDPLMDFRIAEEEVLTKIQKYGDIKCVIHSHNNYPHCSRADQFFQISSGYTFGIINIFNNRIADIWFWGEDIPPDPLVGRTFRNGSHDCYALVADFYQQKGNVILKRRPHPIKWFEDKKDKEGNIIRPAINLIVDNVINHGFHFVDINDGLKYGDVLMGRDRSKFINHTGIFIGQGLMLHHLYGRLSSTEPVILYKGRMEKAARYDKKIEWVN